MLQYAFKKKWEQKKSRDFEAQKPTSNLLREPPSSLSGMMLWRKAFRSRWLITIYYLLDLTTRLLSTGKLTTQPAPHPDRTFKRTRRHQVDQTRARSVPRAALHSQVQWQVHKPICGAEQMDRKQRSITHGRTTGYGMRHTQGLSRACKTPDTPCDKLTPSYLWCGPDFATNWGLKTTNWSELGRLAPGRWKAFFAFFRKKSVMRVWVHSKMTSWGFCMLISVWYWIGEVEMLNVEFWMLKLFLN